MMHGRRRYGLDDGDKKRQYRKEGDSSDAAICPPLLGWMDDTFEKREAFPLSFPSHTQHPGVLLYPYYYSCV